MCHVRSTGGASEHAAANDNASASGSVPSCLEFTKEGDCRKRSADVSAWGKVRVEFTDSRECYATRALRRKMARGMTTLRPVVALDCIAPTPAITTWNTDTHGATDGNGSLPGLHTFQPRRAGVL